MIIALTRERVCREVSDLVRYRLAQTLVAAPKVVQVNFTIGEKGITPDFQIDTGLCAFDLNEVRALYRETWGESFPEDLKTREDVVIEILKLTWQHYKPILQERLHGLKSRWNGDAKEETNG